MDFKLILSFLALSINRELTWIIHEFWAGEISRNACMEKAGMDEATIVGLRERVRSGLLPLRKPVCE